MILFRLINPTGFWRSRSCRRRSFVRSMRIFIALPANNRRGSFGSRMKELKVSSPNLKLLLYTFLTGKWHEEQVSNPY